jgi:hypothetical protein
MPNPDLSSGSAGWRWPVPGPLPTPPEPLGGQMVTVPVSSAIPTSFTASTVNS